MKVPIIAKVGVLAVAAGLVVLVALTASHPAAAMRALQLTSGDGARISRTAMRAMLVNLQVGTSTATPTATSTSTATATSTPAPTSTLTSAPVITLDPSSVTAGVDSFVAVSGSGFSPGETVATSYQPSLVEGGTATEQTTATVQADGTFVAPGLPVPADVAPGIYLVTATGQSSGLSASAVLSISAITPTSTPVPTSTPTATSVPPTFTPTPTPTVITQPAPSISIVKVAILHRVNGREVPTQSLRLREQAEFVVAFHTVHAAGLKTSGVLLVTKSGKRVSGHAMDKTRYVNHRAFMWRITFYKSSREGTLYAHFTVSAGTASAKRDRRFTLRSR